MEGAVELAVAAAVEPVALVEAAGGFDGAGAGQGCEGCFAGHAAGVAGGDDELGGADGAHAAFLQQFRHECVHERFQLPVDRLDLEAEVSHPGGDPAQHCDRDRCFVFAGRKLEGPLGGLFAVAAAEASPQRLGAGHDRSLEFVQGRRASADGAGALRQQRPQVVADTAAAGPRQADAGEEPLRGRFRVDQVALAAAAVAAAGPLALEHLAAGSDQESGQAGAVAARPSTAKRGARARSPTATSACIRPHPPRP